MASIQKTAKGYRAQVCVKGQRKSASFRTRREAAAWAEAQAVELREPPKSAPERYTLADALREYARVVSPHHRGVVKERIRIGYMLRDPALPTTTRMADLSTPDFAKWRDARLKLVSPGSVLRDIALLSSVIETARREWHWIAHNPLRDLRKPRMPDHRDVLITPSQTRAMLRVMGYRYSHPARTVAQAVACCFLVALHTGMRAGELCKLRWDHVRPDHCILPVTKTKPRTVPLTRRVWRVLEQMRGYDPVLVFGMKPQSLDANFRKYRTRAGLSGFTFHDARHSAATRLARRVDVLTLCRIMGWSNPQQAMTYVNTTIHEIARGLER